MNDKLAGILGMAMRARQVKTGDDAFEALSRSDAALLLISNQASERTQKKLSDRCEFYNIDYYVIDDVLLNQSIGKVNKRHALITNQGFAKSIRDILRKR